MTGQDESLIAYCGLYCGNCPIGKGEIADLAKDLLEKFEESKFERVARGLAELLDEFKVMSQYEQCHQVLIALDRLRCKKICKHGGGTESCKIRTCCQEKNIEGCWLCDEFEHCRTLDWLKPVNGDAHLKNLRIIREQGTEKFLEGEKYW